MATVRRRMVVPEGTSVNVRIKKAEEVSGQFGPQIRVDLVVSNGEFQGFEFTDWLKLHEDEDTIETYVKEGGKAWEVLLVALAESGAEDFEDASGGGVVNYLYATEELLEEEGQLLLFVEFDPEPEGIKITLTNER